MLRWILALVVMANLLFLAWSRHWLAPLGLVPESESEPYRLQQQVQPQAIVLRPVSAHNTAAPVPNGAASGASAQAEAAPDAGTAPGAAPHPSAEAAQPQH